MYCVLKRTQSSIHWYIFHTLGDPGGCVLQRWPALTDRPPQRSANGSKCSGSSVEQCRRSTFGFIVDLLPAGAQQSNNASIAQFFCVLYLGVTRRLNIQTALFSLIWSHCCIETDQCYKQSYAPIILCAQISTRSPWADVQTKYTWELIHQS